VGWTAVKLLDDWRKGLIGAAVCQQGQIRQQVIANGPPRAQRVLLVQLGIKPPVFIPSDCSRAQHRVARRVGRPF